MFAHIGIFSGGCYFFGKGEQSQCVFATLLEGFVLSIICLLRLDRWVSSMCFLVSLRGDAADGDAKVKG